MIYNFNDIYIITFLNYFELRKKKLFKNLFNKKKMSSIQSSVQELKEINTEIKRLTKTASELRKRATYIEKNIISFLNEKELPGVKDNRTAVIIENKKKTVTRNKKNIEQQTLKILEENGIQNPKQILDEITKVRKGEQVELQKVKMQEIR